MYADALRPNNGIVLLKNAADSYLRMSESAKKIQLKDEQTVRGNESRYDLDGTLKDERFLSASGAAKAEKKDANGEKLSENVPGEGEEDTKTDKKDKDGFLKDPPDCQCETCRKRRYKDASDDSAVSFQNATRMTPTAAKARVRSHEMEHVRREGIKARQQGRRIVLQSVSIKTDTCEECGRLYVSGGLTRTVTRPDMRDFHNMFMLGFDEDDVVGKDIS